MTRVIGRWVPQELARLETLDAAVNAVAERYDFASHPYFRWLASDAATRGAFRDSQLPFRFAVEAFSQCLAAVLARTPQLERRMGLAANVAEEHGEGSLERSHKHTFEGFLRALGATEDHLALGCPVEVLAFDRALLDHCLVERPEVGAATLGIVEHLYVDISRVIAERILARGWVEPSGQDHYRVHERLDVVHAEDLFTIARPGWRSEHLRPDVARALALGAHHFWSLYAGLLPDD